MVTEQRSLATRAMCSKPSNKTEVAEAHVYRTKGPLVRKPSIKTEVAEAHVYRTKGPLVRKPSTKTEVTEADHVTRTKEPLDRKTSTKAGAMPTTHFARITGPAGVAAGTPTRRTAGPEPESSETRDAGAAVHLGTTERTIKDSKTSTKAEAMPTTRFARITGPAGVAAGTPTRRTARPEPESSETRDAGAAVHLGTTERTIKDKTSTGTADGARRSPHSPNGQSPMRRPSVTIEKTSKTREAARLPRTPAITTAARYRDARSRHNRARGPR
jgi:hypothetical protein